MKTSRRMVSNVHRVSLFAVVAFVTGWLVTGAAEWCVGMVLGAAYAAALVVIGVQMDLEAG